MLIFCDYCFEFSFLEKKRHWCLHPKKKKKSRLSEAIDLIVIHNHLTIQCVWWDSNLWRVEVKASSKTFLFDISPPLVMNHHWVNFTFFLTKYKLSPFLWVENTWDFNNISENIKNFNDDFVIMRSFLIFPRI